MLTVIIGGLITWRLSLMITAENGPMAVFARARAWFASFSDGPGGLYEMFSCISCMSIYIGAAASLAVSSGPLEFIWHTISFSAVAVAVERLTAKK